MTFNTLTTIFAVLAGGALLWWGILKLGKFLQWVERSEIERQAAEAAAKKSSKAPAPKLALASLHGAIPAAHLAAIAAAVGAIGGVHAIVHISLAGTANWASEGRRLQQTSHRPH
ncbi:hypothetical protein [uncultured Rhodoblastus sp.]|uniref:hypothetical protein n=1 Tax=uncultured Rhodoblastus sp. TaxID=543037 RepID=UPI0025F4F0A6|nr:hypothetical protein [uncultured Rhodoblastus sp.]